MKSEQTYTNYSMQPLSLSRPLVRTSILALVVLFLLLSTKRVFGPNAFDLFSISNPTARQHNRFHFLLPATQPDVNLCKAFVSATILGYPIPMLIGWGAGGPNDTPESRRAHQMEKIFSVFNYLDAIDDAHDGDLVIMDDSLDTWFQLPPSILTQRYHKLNVRADELYRAQAGPSTNVTASQSVVFSAEKKCWPRNADDMGCAGLPQSPLPKDIYGPQTDNFGNPLHTYMFGAAMPPQGVEEVPLFQYLRPKYLNSGFFIGPIPDAHALFERASVIARKDLKVYGADQGIFAQIFGEQTYMRESARSAHSPPWKREKMKNFVPEQNQTYEFGVGLDYDRSLSQPTAYAENLSAWVVHKDKKALAEKAKELNVTIPRILHNGLQQDIAQLPKPLDDVIDSAKKETWESNAWDSLPLYTDLWTGVAPAIIHHNAQHDGVKITRDKAWPEMWFAPYVKQLFDAKVAKLESTRETEHKLFKVGGSSYYDSTPFDLVREKGYGAETITLDGQKGWARWEEICDSKAQKEVFSTSKDQLT